MHWLCYDEDTPLRLEQAGYLWDATFGYNDAVGFRAGTTQIYRPLGAQTLYEVPLHAQDTALFLGRRLRLSDDEAWAACERLREHVRHNGGVLTITWHDRSLAPERLWDAFYARLLDALTSDGAWFATVSDAVAWARSRRSARIADVREQDGRVTVRLEGSLEDRLPPMTMRRSVLDADGSPRAIDVPWRGEEEVEVAALASPALRPPTSAQLLAALAWEDGWLERTGPPLSPRPISSQG